MRYFISILILLITASFCYAQGKVIFSDDFETGKLTDSWSVLPSNTLQSLSTQIVYKPFQAKSYSLLTNTKERATVSHVLKAKALKNMIISDKLVLSFVCYAENSDFISLDLNTNKGIFRKTIAPVKPNTWHEVTLVPADFINTVDSGLKITGTVLTGGINISSIGVGSFAIDNVKIEVNKAITITKSKNFVPINGENNFALIDVEVIDEFGQPIKDNTLVKMLATSGMFDLNEKKTKNGKVTFKYTPTNKTGLVTLTAQVGKDTQNIQIVAVDGVKNIIWDFPKTQIEKDLLIELPKAKVSKLNLIKFNIDCKDINNKTINIMGDYYYLYVNGKKAKINKVIEKDSKNILTYDIPNLKLGTNTVVLISKESNKQNNIKISNYKFIKQIKGDAKFILSNIEDLPLDWASGKSSTSWKSIKASQIAPEVPACDVLVKSVLASDYFIKVGEKFDLNIELVNNGLMPAKDIKVAIVDENKNILTSQVIKSLEPSKTEALKFSLVPTKLGYSRYFVVCDPDNKLSESNKKNNVLPLLQSVYYFNKKENALTLNSVDIPKAAKAGDIINIGLDMKSKNDLTNKKAYIRFKNENRLFYVYEFNIKSGNTVKTIEKIDLPKDIPSGKYIIEAGVYKEAYVNKNIKDALVGEIDITSDAKIFRKPMSYGTFVDMENVPHSWYVNHANTLIWNGYVYFPSGYMFVGTNFMPDGNNPVPVDVYTGMLEELEVMQGVNAVGIMDMENTSKIIAYMQEKGMTFCSGAGYGNTLYWEKYPLISWQIKNGKYYTPVLKAGRTEYNMLDISSSDNLKSALYVLVDMTDNKPILSGSAEVKGYVLSVDIPEGKLIDSHTYNVYFTPEVVGGHTIFDFWSSFEERKARALDIIKNIKLPNGTRYVIDPFVNEEGFFFNNDTNKVPNSKVYLEEYSGWLKNKYTNIDNLNKSWALVSGSISDFNEAANIIPLQIVGDKSFVYNKIKNEIVTLDAKKSIFWYDMLEARDQSLLRLHNEYADFFKEYIDLPMISKRVGGHSKSFTPSTEYGGFDGVGVDCYNLADVINKITGSYLGDVEDSPKTGWLPTLEINYETPSPSKPTTGWPSKEVMLDDFARFLEMGVKGFNVFALDLRNTSGDVFTWPKFDVMLHPEQLAWYKGIQNKLSDNMDIISNYKPKVCYWYPTLSPETGSFTYNDFSHYGLQWSSLLTKSGYWFIPTDHFNHTQLTMTSLPNSPASTFYGDKLNDSIKKGLAPIMYMGLRQDLGQIPELDKYFTNKYSTATSPIYGEVKIQVLNPSSDFEVIYKNDKGEVYGIRKDNLTIISMDVNPGAYLEKEDLPIVNPIKIDLYKDILKIPSHNKAVEVNLDDYKLDESKSYILLGTLIPTFTEQGYGNLQVNKNINGKPLSSGGVKFKNGLATHAPAQIVYNIDGKYKKFECFIGVDMEHGGLGSVTYQVLADGKEIFASGLVTGKDLPRKISLDVSGVKELKLIVTDANDGSHADHADFLEARLYN